MSFHWDGLGDMAVLMPLGTKNVGFVKQLINQEESCVDESVEDEAL